jgi:UDP-glucose 4-epimerase
MVLPRFAERAIRGEPLTVYGDGTQTRCFCHVSDTVRAIAGLLEEPSAYGSVFNIGSQEEVSILELARRTIAAAGSASSVDFVTYEQAYEEGFEDMQRRVPDISKIRSLLGWEPRFRLDDIISEVVYEARQATSGVVG